MQRSFFWKLFTGYALLVALVALIFIFTVSPLLRGAYEDDIESSLASQATLLSEVVRPTLVQFQTEGVDERTNRLAAALQTRLVAAGASAHSPV